MKPGLQLLHYRLVEKIGEGGMGEVWQAEDTSLGRDVAIKILPEAVAHDAERLARFEREARLLATLNHPNIASVYGLHAASSDDDRRVHFLAMELVEGEDLADRIARGPLEVDEALEIAAGIAEGLRSAHASGVIHRDLKPANVRLGNEGAVKVLDFGLAKALSADGEPTGSGASPSISPTVTSLGTVAGVILGTAAYMSPEQARGKPVDKRADIWAFGCVLYEMLTGRLPFHGETITDTLAAVVRAEVDWDRLPEAVPGRVRHVLKLCLAKDPRARLHDIADAALLLGGADDDGEPTPRRVASNRREILAWALAAVAIVVAIAVGWPRRPDTAVVRPTRFTIHLDAETSLENTPEPNLAFSPDGRSVAFSALDPESGHSILYLRDLDQTEPWPVPGTETASTPFFSPDGEHLGFFARGELCRIARGGGAPITVASAPNPRGGVWLADDTIVYSPEFAGGLWRVSAAGGRSEPLAEPDAEQGERTFRWPSATPDGRSVLFTVGQVGSPNSYDSATLDVLSLADGKRRTLLEGVNMARLASRGTLAFGRAGVLYAVRVDPVSLAPRGEPIPVLEGVGGDPTSGAVYFDLSSTGDLVLAEGISQELSNLVVVDRAGPATPLTLEPRIFHHPRLAPDGSAVAVTLGARGPAGAGGNVWIHSFADQGLRRLTFGDSDVYPLWYPDGTRIAFWRSGSIVSVASDGSGEVRPIAQTEGGVLFPSAWTPDARTLAYMRTTTRTDVFLLTIGEDQPRLVVEDAHAPVISPNGRWIVYSAPVSGSASVYVEPLDGEGKWQVSPGVGAHPRWSADGRLLFYIAIGDPGRPLMEVPVEEGEAFRYGSPRVVLGDTTPYSTATAPVMNWDTDGEKFVFVEFVRDEEALRRVEVVLDWAAALNLPEH